MQSYAERILDIRTSHSYAIRAKKKEGQRSVTKMSLPSPHVIIFNLLSTQPKAGQKEISMLEPSVLEQIGWQSDRQLMGK